jgi:dihydroflavonol-4-reductase
MKPTLVTGATGFVGWHVARQLLDRGDAVRALARDPSKLRELDGVEAIRGDLRDADSLKRAVEGCGVVYHVAADYRLWTRDPQDMFRSNVEGTRNLLDAARRAGVERVVYTSTVGCMGFPKGELGDEQTAVCREDIDGAIQVFQMGRGAGRDRIRGHGIPSGDREPDGSCGRSRFQADANREDRRRLRARRDPAFLDTGLNVVDVRDVAAGHLAACERGRSGERYILGAENLTLEKILGTLAQAVGKPAPRMRVPYAVAYAAGAVSTGWANLTGKGTGGAIGRSSYGAQENVGAARQSGARAGLCAASGRGGAGSRGRVVSRQRLLLNAHVAVGGRRKARVRWNLATLREHQRN